MPKELNDLLIGSGSGAAMNNSGAASNVSSGG